MSRIMSELQKKLANYGVNFAVVMERFVDDEELYESCLAMFLEDETCQHLGEAIKNGQYDEAFNYAHTLKGVVGNLGLTPLYDVICNIVEPLRMHDYSDLDNQYKAIMEKLGELKKNYN